LLYVTVIVNWSHRRNFLYNGGNSHHCWYELNYVESSVKLHSGPVSYFTSSAMTVILVVYLKKWCTVQIWQYHKLWHWHCHAALQFQFCWLACSAVLSSDWQTVFYSHWHFHVEISKSRGWTAEKYGRKRMNHVFQSPSVFASSCEVASVTEVIKAVVPC